MKPSSDRQARPGGRLKRVLHVRNLAPNIITTLALCAGMTAIRFALQDRFDLAVIAIILAGVLDGLDGTIARLLKATSRFGAELDSLSDVVAFGLAPAVVLYIWTLSDWGGMGWVIALAFAISCALRLARFNAMQNGGNDHKQMAGFFTGVPAPAGAGLAVLPMVLYFETGLAYFRDPVGVGLFTAVVAFLLVSTVATFSIKRFVIRRDYTVPALFVVALFAASLTVYGWIVLAACGLIYLLSIPYSAWRYKRWRDRRSRQAG